MRSSLLATFCITGLVSVQALGIASRPSKSSTLQQAWTTGRNFTRIENATAFKAAVLAATDRQIAHRTLSPAQAAEAKEAVWRLLVGYSAMDFERFWAFRCPTGETLEYPFTDVYFDAEFNRVEKEFRRAGITRLDSPSGQTNRERLEALWRQRGDLAEHACPGSRVLDAVALSEIRLEFLHSNAPLAEIIRTREKGDSRHFTRATDGAPFDFFQYTSTREINSLFTSYGYFGACSAKTAQDPKALYLVVAATAKTRSGTVTPVYVLYVWDVTTFVPVEIGAGDTGDRSWKPVF